MLRQYIRLNEQIFVQILRKVHYIKLTCIVSLALQMTCIFC